MKRIAQNLLGVAITKIVRYNGEKIEGWAK
jgi:hypothetical protein